MTKTYHFLVNSLGRCQEIAYSLYASKMLANMNDPLGLVVLVRLVIMIGASNHYDEDHNSVIIIIVHIVKCHNFHKCT